MSHVGDYRPGDTVYVHFNTVSSATPPVPITLAGSPAVSVYKDASDTQTTTGVTLSVDHDGTTGSHRVAIVTSDAFYANLSSFAVKITTGTVDTASVVGTTVGTFTIGQTFRNLIEDTLEDGESLGNVIRLMASVLLGIASGMGTTTGVFRDLADTKTRVEVTQDEFGNRSVIITRDGS